MENLLKPDFGVLLLTVCNFLLLVFLLKKFAWGPILGALEKREAQIESDKQTAAQARKSAEEMTACGVTCGESALEMPGQARQRRTFTNISNAAKGSNPPPSASFRANAARQFSCSP